MAAIDKIYVTKRQYLVLREWYADMEKNGLIPVNLPWDQYKLEDMLNNWDEKDEEDIRPVWNLSEKSDLWLLSNCPFDFVKKNIMYNFGYTDILEE